MVENRLEQGLDSAQASLDTLSQLGINLSAITDKLEKDGVASFSEAFDRLLTAITDEAAKYRS